MKSVYQSESKVPPLSDPILAKNRYLKPNLSRKLAKSQLGHSYTIDRDLRGPKSLRTSLERDTPDTEGIDYEAEIDKNQTSRLIFNKLHFLTEKHKLEDSLGVTSGSQFSLKANKLNQKYINTLKKEL